MPEGVNRYKTSKLSKGKLFPNLDLDFLLLLARGRTNLFFLMIYTYL